MEYQKAVYKFADGDSVWLAPNVNEILVVADVVSERGELTVILKRADSDA